MPDHRKDPSANALAHGAAKIENIESTRLALDRIRRLVADELRASAARSRPDSARREGLDRRLAGPA